MKQYIDLNDQRPPVARALCTIWRIGLVIAGMFAIVSIYFAR